MKVNLFQEASRAARSRATQGSLRAYGNTARGNQLVDQAAGNKSMPGAYRRGMRRIAGNLRATGYYEGNRSLFNNMTGAGGAKAASNNSGSAKERRANAARQRGYRAPRTRLY
jgi:hypothetical protein